MLNTVRGLRDSFKDTLCYLVGMRQEVVYLPNPEALGDVYELLDSHVCQVGAMNEADARNLLGRTTHTAPSPPTEAELQAMLALSGHFPVLLKAIGHWWLNSPTKPRPAEWLDVLAGDHSFEYRLARLWHGLTQEEQFILAAVREWQERLAQATEGSPIFEEAFRMLNQEYGHILPHLEAKGVCRRIEMGWQVKGELLADYVKRVGPSSRGRIRLDHETEEIYQGLTPMHRLTPEQDKLLHFLLRQPYKRHASPDLIAQIWAEEAGQARISPINLMAVVSDLRNKIEVRPSEPRYLITWRNDSESGYRFYPEGCPE